MDQQDKTFVTIISAVLGLLVFITIAIFIIAHLVVDDDAGEQDAFRAERAAQQLAKPGHVVVAGTPAAEQEQARLAGGGTTAAAEAELGGEQLYQQVCASCHAQGLLNSPKPGDTAAWEPRYQQGLDTLVQHAVGGFNQMPPQGQAPGATEDNIKAAVVYMLEQSGIELAATDAELAAEAAPATTEQAAAAEPAAEAAPAETEQAAAEPAAEAAPAETEQATAEPAAEAAPAETEQATAEPAAEAAPAETEQAAAEPAAEAAPAETEQAAAEPAAEAAPAETEQAAAEPAAEAEQAAAEPAAEAAPAATEQSAPVAASAGATAPAATAPAEAAATPAGLVLPDGLDLTQGQQVYDTVCRFCHLGNIPSAPKFGDKEAWAPRAAQGWDTLKGHVLNGFKGMPAKGGRTDMSDEQILNALGYMLSESQ
ncbi:MAG: c-type cytochrome [Gammaproteobacteria bacterium]